MRALLLPALLLLTLATASADVVWLKDGSRREGRVVDQGPSIRVITPHGSISIEKSQIDHIDAGPSPWDSYAEKAAALLPEDADGHFALAEWCGEHRMPIERQRELEAAVLANPDHAAARKALGFVLQDGRWMTEREALIARGMVEYEGRWVRPEERDLLEEAKRTIEIQKEYSARLKQWIRQTGDEDPLVRKEAYGKLEQIPPADLVEPLLAALYDENPEVRAYATAALAKMPDTRVVRGLVYRTLYDASPAIAEMALRSLQSMNLPETTSKFCESLRSRQRGVRLRAEISLGEIGDERAIEPLIDAFEHSLRENAGTVSITETNPDPAKARGGASLFGGTGQEVVGATGGIEDGSNNPDQIYAERQAILAALKKLTGFQFGYNLERWRWWLELQKKNAKKDPDPAAPVK
ncbi:MAG: HEAT repeat domain-containing protein [Planctomycetes bacterium]|nr:HEAT repeat domain-containing protein [Planctomycetota bacterium]